MKDPEKEQFLRGTTALLFPIEWPEPFELVMIEAMACGTPVIAFWWGSVPKVMEEGASGFIVEAEAVVALAERIVLMSHGPRARIAEIVVNTLPRPRSRHDLHRHSSYYPLRNHIIEFLIERSQRARDAPPATRQSCFPALLPPFPSS